VDPVNRRGLLGAGAAATAGGLGAVTPAAAREIDPGLVAHSMQLLSVLGRHDAMFGPRDVLGIVRNQLDLIAKHRLIAHGELHNQLLRVESRWAQFAAWLSNDAGQPRSRDAWIAHALRLAREAGYTDMVALARWQQGQWAAQDLDARRVIAFAENALCVPATSEQTRALCTLRAAVGHALANDVAACERCLADAEVLVEHTDSPAPPWAGEFSVTHNQVRATEARCWLWMQPSKAIPLYERILREWPRDRMRDGALHQARLALACAATGEHDRATVEGRKALTIARATNSSVVTRELKRLGQTLRAES
jgi:hypothetical protein